MTTAQYSITEIGRMRSEHLDSNLKQHSVFKLILEVQQAVARQAERSTQNIGMKCDFETVVVLVSIMLGHEESYPPDISSIAAMTGLSRTYCG